MSSAPGEELRLLARLPHQEQQLSIGGLHVQHLYIRLGVRPADDLEELAPAVGPHVERNGDFQPRRDPVPSASFILAPIRANFSSSVSRSNRACLVVICLIP